MLLLLLLLMMLLLLLLLLLLMLVLLRKGARERGPHAPIEGACRWAFSSPERFASALSPLVAAPLYRPRRCSTLSAARVPSGARGRCWGAG